MAGGKWTTYRHMAEDLVNHAETLADLEPRPCVTRSLSIHGFHKNAAKFGELAAYGSDAPALTHLFRAEAGCDELVHPRLSVRVGEVVWAARTEMARTVDDFLARRTRALIMDARAASEAAPVVARILADELGRDEAWQQGQVRDFQALAAAYLPRS